MAFVAKILAALLLLCVVLLAGCTSAAPKSQAKATESVEHQQALFNKKVACKREQDKLKENLEQDRFTFEAIYRVFYSPKLDSCVAAKYTLYMKPNFKDSESAELFDVLTGKQIWYESYPVSKTYPEVEADLDQAIQSQNLEQ